MISKATRLGLTFAALLMAGAEECSKKGTSAPPTRLVPTQVPTQLVGKIIGYNSYEPLCGDGPSWEVEEETLDYRVVVCVPFQDDAIINWRMNDSEAYRMTVSPKLGQNGAVLTATDYRDKAIPVVNLDQIAAIGLLPQVTTVGEINLFYPSEKNLCPNGEHLYGLRIPAAEALPGGHRRILFCSLENLPFSRRITLTAQATATKDQVGRPVYRALDVKVLEEL